MGELSEFRRNNQYFWRRTNVIIRHHIQKTFQWTYRLFDI